MTQERKSVSLKENLLLNRSPMLRVIREESIKITKTQEARSQEFLGKLASCKLKFGNLFATFASAEVSPCKARNNFSSWLPASSGCGDKTPRLNATAAPIVFWEIPAACHSMAT